MAVDQQGSQSPADIIAWFCYVMILMAFISVPVCLVLVGSLLFVNTFWYQQTTSLWVIHWVLQLYNYYGCSMFVL
jgi:hypothetical protein